MFSSKASFSTVLLSAFVYSEAVTTEDIHAYDVFRSKYGRTDEQGSDMYAHRLELFAKRRNDVAMQNERVGASWKAEVNQYADYTEGEKQSLFGYRRLGNWWSADRSSSSGGSSSFLQTRDAKLVAESVDWRGKLNSSTFVRDQGSCGSCWAVAAVGALEMHAELGTSGFARQLSFKQLVDCTPNPRHCGGEGGCKGATAELAFTFVQQNGLAAAEDYTGDISSGEACRANTSPMIQSKGFIQLPVNEQAPLIEAIATKGPVVISVDAGPWMNYAGGVFNGCNKDATINHAVLLVGYGRDATLGKDYWLIRNSWGPEWGEKGFIRLERYASDKGEEGKCGTDKDPKQGVGCDGGPATLPVCGECGMLSDSSYPTLVTPAASTKAVVKAPARNWFGFGSKNTSPLLGKDGFSKMPKFRK